MAEAHPAVPPREEKRQATPAVQSSIWQGGVGPHAHRSGDLEVSFAPLQVSRHPFRPCQGEQYGHASFGDVLHLSIGYPALGQNCPPSRYLNRWYDKTIFPRSEVELSAADLPTSVIIEYLNRAMEPNRLIWENDGAIVPGIDDAVLTLIPEEDFHISIDVR